MIRRLLGWLASLVTRPRHPAPCSRCGRQSGDACWRVDCPRHEGE